ncbi:glycosyl transferase [Frankia sp. CcI49]|uniref:MraY family glycosyltransferase n=1 Tax=unclassified Frankia TaxID=2632575 RepID=UPI0006C9FB84|nr:MULTISPECIES: glycosyltransferase family 4 protein [unclassified Frankia]KPM54940.1 glycosyl transferase [Frankia sp. R43]ONH61146.1 glycosyl transferase [Frankia sp. CcI49]
MIAAGAAALLVTVVAMPVVVSAMRRLAAIDDVNERSSHRVPTPRGGGIAVALGIFAGVVVLQVTSGHGDSPGLLPMIVGVTLFGLVGLAEDVGADAGGISPLRRLALQLLAGLVVSAVLLTSVSLDAAPIPPVVAVSAAALIGPLWITGFVNAFNFMDGVNGISSAQAAVAGGSLIVVGHLYEASALAAGGTVLVGSAIGFAPFNFPRARIFLGDVGSYTLGTSLAVLALQGILSGIPVEAVLAPLLLYLADTGATLVRRVLRGERWYLPHRTHTYQRLTDVGWTHTRVTVTVASLVAASSGLGLLAARGDPGIRVTADLALLVLVVGYLNAPRLITLAHARGCAERPAPADPAHPGGGSRELVLPHQRQGDSPQLTPDRAEPSRPARVPDPADTR